MAESDRLKLRQVTILARLQAYRDEQAARQAIAARRRADEAEQAVQHAARAYERECIQQTQARSQRWQEAIGQELDYQAIQKVRAEDLRGFAAIEHQELNREKTQRDAIEAQVALLEAEQRALAVRTALARRNALQQNVLREDKHFQKMQEELLRDQQSQMLFGRRFGDAPV